MIISNYFYKVQMIIGYYCLCVIAMKDNDGCHCGSKLRRQTIFDARKEEYCVIDNSKVTAVDVNRKTIETMVKINDGLYSIGTNKPVFVADGEGPKRNVILNSFYIDKFEVSNKDFTAFINSTGYKTDAENFGDSFVFEGLLSKNAKNTIKKAVAQAPWWLPVKQATWQHPEGPKSNITCKCKIEERMLKYLYDKNIIILFIFLNCSLTIFEISKRIFFISQDGLSCHSCFLERCSCLLQLDG